MMRHGENARDVIDRVKARLKELEPSLPEGVRIVTTYDRSELIQRSIDTLKHELILEIIIVSLVILVFLWHIPSAIVPIVTIPISVLLAFIPMYFMGITSNIMSLAGIAISIGVLVDGAIVEVENAYKKLELWQRGGRQGDFHAVRLEALLEVGPSVFFSLLVIAVAFLPVFTLVDQEGRLFKPLAWTKNLAMAIAAVLALTLDPALRMLFTRMDFVHFRPRWLAWLVNQVTVGRYYPEEKHPISRVLFAVYEPACRAVLRHPKTTIAIAVLVVATTVPVYLRLGHEFMPPLNEGTILYMPTTLPGHLGDRGEPAAAGAGPDPEVVPRGGARLRQGRPRRDVHRPGAVLDDGDDRRPQAAVRVAAEGALVLVLGAGVAQRPPVAAPLAGPALLGRADRRDERGAPDPRHHQRLDHADQGPHRHAHHRRPHAGRHQDLRRRPRGDRSDRASASRPSCETCPARAASSPSAWPAATSSTSTSKRDELARYGLTVAEAQDVIMSAVGGENVTTTIEGRERYPVNVRYPRELRDDLETPRARAGADPVGGADPARRSSRRSRRSRARR